MKTIALINLFYVVNIVAVLGQNPRPHRNPSDIGPRPDVTTPLPKPTFYVEGKQLKDPCGVPIQLVGVNKMSIFRLNQEPAAQYFADIAKTGANCVRIVWGIRKDETTLTTAQELDFFISKCKEQKMIPIVGLWDYTDEPDGGFSHLQEYVNYWKRADILSIIKKYEGFLIINIANEAAEAAESGDDDAFLAAKTPNYIVQYSSAIQQLRTAGIRVPLMIDGLDRGKSLRGFSYKRNGGPKNVATELLEADTKRNIIFSIHPYWNKVDTDSDGFKNYIKDTFAEAIAGNFCFVLGEIARYGAFNSNESVCDPAGEVDYLQFINLCNTNKIGWLIWEWGMGIEEKDAKCVIMNMVSENNGIYTLTNWGNEMVNANYGIKANAKKTDYFFKDCLCENVLLTFKTKVTPVTTPGIGTKLEQIIDWSSNSQNIQSYTLEVEELNGINQILPLKSVKFPSNSILALQKSYEYVMGRGTAKLKVFRKNGGSCYVSLRE